MLTWKEDALLTDGITIGGVFKGAVGDGSKGWSYWVGSLSGEPTHNASNGGQWFKNRGEAVKAADVFCTAHPERFKGVPHGQ
jgi:hypothetical protein